MPNLSRAEVKGLALIGAQSRLDALRKETASILRTFPELGHEISTPKGTRKSQKRKMSAEARKRIGDAQRARWAQQREGKKR